MISDEAVEAAAKALVVGVVEGDWLGWDDLTELGREQYRCQALRVLEAAAPYMVAEAWDEGEQAGAMNHAAEEYPEVKDVTNPYRSQA